MKRLRRVAVVTGVTALLWPALGAATLEDQVKAAFLLNFAKFVEWPEGTFEHVRQPVTLCVWAGAETVEVIEAALRGKTVGTRPLRVVGMESPDAHCDMVYLRGDRDDVMRLFGALEAPGVLSVYETEERLPAGVIRFFIDERKVRFEVDLDAAERQRLVISSKLLRVARIAP